MSKKIFKSRNIGMKNTFAVRDSGGGVHFTVTNNDGKVAGCDLANADAPAIALAILEAAGVVHHDPEDTPHDPKQRTDQMGDLNIAAYHLFAHVTRAEKIAHIQAQEAADREALDAEALELYNKVMRSGKAPLSEWLPTLQFKRIKYTNIAKAARELHGPTK